MHIVNIPAYLRSLRARSVASRHLGGLKTKTTPHKKTSMLITYVLASVLLLLTGLSLSTQYLATSASMTNKQPDHESHSHKLPNGAVMGNLDVAKFSVSSLPIAVDGAKNPERVPDKVAYRHLVMVVAQPETATADQVKPRNAILTWMGLSQEDKDALIAALRGVSAELKDITEQRKQWATDSPSARSALETLRHREDQLFNNAQTRLRESLSLGGLMHLDAYIQQHIKPRIVIYGAIPK
jgi:hypothetical protein